MTPGPTNAELRDAITRQRILAGNNGVLIRVDLDELPAAARALARPGIILELEPSSVDDVVTIIVRGLEPGHVQRALEATALQTWGLLR